MTSPLGFVVLAKRPNQPPEPVSAVFPEYPNGLEQAQNALEACQQRHKGCQLGCAGDDEKIHYGWFRCTPESRVMLDQEREFDPVVYTIGEITQVETK